MLGEASTTSSPSIKKEPEHDGRSVVDLHTYADYEKDGET